MSYYHAVVGSISDTPVSNWGQWIWPLMATNGVLPTISDGFGTEKRDGAGHFGADIMHRIPKGNTNPLEEKHTKGYAVFKGETAVLAGPGKVYDSEMTKTGWTVRVNHRVDGRPIMSVYRHLKGSDVKKDQVLNAGHPLGPIGDNLADPIDPAHLHFELWDTSTNNEALYQRFKDSSKGGEYLKWIFNPAQVMGPWRVLYENGTIRPHDGDKGDQGEKPGGGGDGKAPIVLGTLVAIVWGWLTFRKS